jgi:hypothetical protein
MGLDIEITNFLLQESETTIKGKSVLMIGRQTLEMGQRELSDLLKDHKISPSIVENIDWNERRRPYANSLFEGLGAKSVSTMDYSDYEGANVIHDLNDPVPDELKSKFDFICESGTLEHIFNFPVAIKNLMSMLKVGGKLMWAGPANNFFGHGFYQFSPELVFRVLSPENGFQIERKFVVEYSLNRPWYEVCDPALKGDRVKLINDRPVNLLVTAKKISDVSLFQRTPQQSDYVAEWEAERKPAVPANLNSKRKRLIRKFKDLIINGSPYLTSLGRSFQSSSLNNDYSFKNTKSFKKVKK